jgi:hypothetical protein
MAAYAIATLNRGAAGQPAVMAPENYDAVWTIYSETPFPPPDTHYGLGWQLGSFLSMLPAQSVAVIVMTNFNDMEEFIMPAFNMRDGLLDIVLEASIEK